MSPRERPTVETVVEVEVLDLPHTFRVQLLAVRRLLSSSLLRRYEQCSRLSQTEDASPDRGRTLSQNDYFTAVPTRALIQEGRGP